MTSPQRLIAFAHELFHDFGCLKICPEECEPANFFATVGESGIREANDNTTTVTLSSALAHRHFAGVVDSNPAAVKMVRA